jgi:hypothetical protein
MNSTNQTVLEKLTVAQLVKKIPALCGNPKFHFRAHNTPPMVRILGQMDPVYTHKHNISEIHLNIILPSTPIAS